MFRFLITSVNEPYHIKRHLAKEGKFLNFNNKTSPWSVVAVFMLAILILRIAG